MKMQLTIEVEVSSVEVAIGLVKGVSEHATVTGMNLYSLPENVPTTRLGLNLEAAALTPKEDPYVEPEQEQDMEPEQNQDTETEAVVALPADIPYIGTLRKSGLALDAIEEMVRDGRATDITGIGDAGAEKLAEYFGTEEAAEEEVEEEGLDDLLGEESDDEPEYTEQDVRKALMSLSNAQDIKAVKKVLAEFDVQQASQIPEEQWGAVIARAIELAEE